MSAKERREELPGPVQEELVAYLDGELDHARQLQIERRLADDPAYREDLLRLQRSWDLLDNLPHADTDEGFTKSTISMAVVQAQSAEAPEQRTKGGVRRWLLWCGGLAAATAAGFVAIAIPLLGAHRSQLRDVPVIENLDMYRYADSVDFLHLLNNEGLFADDEENVL